MILSRVRLLALAQVVTFAACGPLNLKVRTSNGLIVGHEAQNRSAVAEFLGIPYAQPPVGDLRFAAPEAYNGTSSYAASKFVSHSTFYRTNFLLELTSAM